jgi:purine-cytosine permease-like protein
MKNREQATRLEINTIQPIPFDSRHGRARDLFTVWFGTNLHLLTIVTGGLAVTVFRLPFEAAISNAMNLYCGALCVLTFGQTLISSWSPGAGAHMTP